jgi:hypothetical protein
MVRGHGCGGSELFVCDKVTTDVDLKGVSRDFGWVECIDFLMRSARPFIQSIPISACQIGIVGRSRDIYQLAMSSQTSSTSKS